LTSGVIFDGIQHGFIAERIQTGHQTAPTFVNANLLFWFFGIGSRGAKTKLQAFLDQTREASLLLRGQGFGIGKQRIVNIQRGLHAGMMQISVYLVNS